MNISQSARRLVFCCPFRAGGLEVAQEGESLQILTEGQHLKFVEKVGQVCFHGPSAIERGQDVLYVTERAVLRLTPDGLELAEVAPGIDRQSEVLDQMGFGPRMV